MADTKRLEAEALAVIRTCAAERLGRAPEYIDVERCFGELGLDSVVLLELSSRLSDHFQVEVADFSAYEHATPAALAVYVAALVGTEPAAVRSPSVTGLGVEDESGSSMVLPRWAAKVRT
jgi:acyl carrier protein